MTARNVIRLTSGLTEGRGYKGKQIAWGQANAIFLDRSVDAAVRPGTNPASFIPIMAVAGKLNLVSVPKAKFEGKGWQKYLNAPGMAPAVFPVSELAHYGDSVRVISDDNMFRTVANGGGDLVHKKMDKKLAKALTAAFIKSVPDLLRKVPFAKGLLFGSIDAKKMAICYGNGTKNPLSVSMKAPSKHGRRPVIKCRTAPAEQKHRGKYRCFARDALKASRASVQ